MLTTSVGVAMPLSSSMRSAVTENVRRAASRVGRLTRISEPFAAAPMRAARLTPVPALVRPGAAGLRGVDADAHRRREALPLAMGGEAALKRDHRLDRP
jgi:hypothetical protein